MTKTEKLKLEGMLVALRATVEGMESAFGQMREQLGHYDEWETMKDGFELAEMIAKQTVLTTIRHLEEI